MITKCCSPCASVSFPSMVPCQDSKESSQKGHAVSTSVLSWLGCWADTGRREASNIMQWASVRYQRPTNMDSPVVMVSTIVLLPLGPGEQAFMLASVFGIPPAHLRIYILPKEQTSKPSYRFAFWCIHSGYGADDYLSPLCIIVQLFSIILSRDRYITVFMHIFHF